MIRDLDMNLFKQIVAAEGVNYQENYQISRKQTVIDQNEFAQLKTKFELKVSKATGFTELYLKDCYRPSSKTNTGRV